MCIPMVFDVVDQVITNVSQSILYFIGRLPRTLMGEQKSSRELLEDFRYSGDGEGVRWPVEWLVHFYREPGLEHGSILERGV